MKITLTEWAARRYSPPPSAWVLRRWTRDGELHPAPELVGKSYYIDENARRLTAPAADVPRLTLVERLKNEARAL
jgi:predicted site-specific integrase-resolvase